MIAPSRCAYARTFGNSIWLPETADRSGLLARRRAIEAGGLGRPGCCSGCRRFTPVYRNPINLPKLAITWFRGGGPEVAGRARSSPGEPASRVFSHRAGASTRRCRAAPGTVSGTGSRRGWRRPVGGHAGPPPSPRCSVPTKPTSQQSTTYKARPSKLREIGVTSLGRMAGPARRLAAATTRGAPPGTTHQSGARSGARQGLQVSVPGSRRNFQSWIKSCATWLRFSLSRNSRIAPSEGLPTLPR